MRDRSQAVNKNTENMQWAQKRKRDNREKRKEEDIFDAAKLGISVEELKKRQFREVAEIRRRSGTGRVYVSSHS